MGGGTAQVREGGPEKASSLLRKKFRKKFLPVTFKRENRGYVPRFKCRHLALRPWTVSLTALS